MRMSITFPSFTLCRPWYQNELMQSIPLFILNVSLCRMSITALPGRRSMHWNSRLRKPRLHWSQRIRKSAVFWKKTAGTSWLPTKSWIPITPILMWGSWPPAQTMMSTPFTFSAGGWRRQMPQTLRKSLRRTTRRSVLWKMIIITCWHRLRQSWEIQSCSGRLRCSLKCTACPPMESLIRPSWLALLTPSFSASCLEMWARGCCSYWEATFFTE